MQLQKKRGIQHRLQKIKREKIQALSLAKDCYSMKLDLLTNATVVDDAIRFISVKFKEKEKIKLTLEGDKEESKEPDYDEEKSDRGKAGRGNMRNNN